jgi:hypothetical protein
MMDRKEKAGRPSAYANEREIDAGTARTLPGPTGRDDGQGAEPGSASAEDVAQPVGAQPRSNVTGRHDPGTGANETVDGLSATEEMTRRQAEDTAPDAIDDDEGEEEMPVFDRAETIGKL